jgi:glycosyltransferase involved in cell wall biosynthesis
LARIVQFVLTLEIGGLERMVVDLALQQKKSGDDVHIYCLFHSGPVSAAALEAGIPIVEFHGQALSVAAKMFFVAKALLRDRPDIVHSHNPGVHPYAALAAKIASVPVVINTRHGTASNLGNCYQERKFRSVYGLTDRVVFVSNETRKFYVDKLGLYESKSAVIANGIPTSAFRSRPAQPGSKSPRIRFGTVGRLAPVKAHDVLLDAFALVSRQLSQAELRIVGAGEMRHRLTEQIRALGLGDRVRLDGSTTEIPKVLSELDVFVISSDSEGLPLAVLEAMAAGLPIVSTRVGGIPEVAPEGSVAWYCPPRNPVELAQAMISAGTSQNLRSMGETAAQVVTRHFDVRTMHSRYAGLYSELLSYRRS